MNWIINNSHFDASESPFSMRLLCVREGGPFTVQWKMLVLRPQLAFSSPLDLTEYVAFFDNLLKNRDPFADHMFSDSEWVFLRSSLYLSWLPHDLGFDGNLPSPITISLITTCAT